MPRWPALARALRIAADLPLAVALLAVLRPLAALPAVAPRARVARASSWGLYLGQLLVHNATAFRCGLTSELTVAARRRA